MERSYRIVSLGGGANNTDNQIVQVSLTNYIQLLLQFRTDIKLFHWKTGSFTYHKISDELLGTIDDLSDKLVEAICGVYGIRPQMENQNIIIKNIFDVSEMKDEIRSVAAELKKTSQIMSISEIANIRDELLGSIDKALYLLSFQ
jgi:hypothetical protein